MWFPDNPTRLAAAALRVARAVVFACAVATAGVNGGAVEIGGGEVTESVKELAGSSAVVHRHHADGTPGARPATGLLARPACECPGRAHERPARHVSHSLPNGLRAPLRC